MPNFTFIALILTEILAEIAKLTHELTPHFKKKPITTISEIIIRKPRYQVSMCEYQN